MKKHAKIDLRPEARKGLPEGIRHVLDNSLIAIRERPSDTRPIFRQQRPPRQGG
ncbi:hypothetical protein ACQVP2_07400 [Methylobacterium aquaticum]|uniref:hypothetical protein n=1 Tax=Methylobacterium aquaticum TaxID=270351 RepID=UPI003D1741E5